MVAVGCAVVLSVLIVADRAGWLLDDPGDWARYEGKTFEVTRVVDGDTLDVRAPDGSHATTRVRLWGIDAPEHARPDRNRPAEPFAQEATDWLSRRCEGRSVTLRLQRHRLRGRYGRLLAYVELADGLVVNEGLISAGLAPIDRRFSHDRMHHYERLERDAQQQRVGVWAHRR